MRIFKHLKRFLKDIFVYAWENKAWWLVPIVLLLLLISVLVIAGKVSAPFIYTLF